MPLRFGFYSLLCCLLVSLWVGAPPAHAADVMQCMSDCVKHEGNSATAKSICKSRCANVAAPQMNGGKKRSCMAVYKECNRSCTKTDKNCRRQCKGALMECG